MLQNASLLAIVAVYTAENEPSEVPSEGRLVLGSRATVGWTYVLDPEETGSVEIISQVTI